MSFEAPALLHKQESEPSYVGGGFDATPFTAATVGELRSTIVSRIAATGGGPHQLWRALVASAPSAAQATATGGSVRKMTRDAFGLTLRAVLGCEGDASAVDEAFAWMDDDESGAASYSEVRLSARARTSPRTHRLTRGGGSVARARRLPHTSRNV